MEKWSLTLREERRLMVFENRVLRRIFGPIRDKLMRSLSPSIIWVINSRIMTCYGQVAHMGERGKHRILVGKSEGKQLL
jgi:hypothetical protein